MQYFFLAAFCWIPVEGIYLYLFVVKVYNINNKMKIYYVMSWGKSLSNELFYCFFPLYLLSTMNELTTMVQRNALFYLFFFLLQSISGLPAVMVAISLSIAAGRDGVQSFVREEQ